MSTIIQVDDLKVGFVGYCDTSALGLAGGALHYRNVM